MLQREKEISRLGSFLPGLTVPGLTAVGLTVLSLTVLGCAESDTPDSSSRLQGESIGIESGVALLGQGFDKKMENFTGICVTSEDRDSEPKWQYFGASQAQVDLKKVDSYETLHSLLDVQVSGKLKYPQFSVSGAAKFLSDAKATETAISLVYSAGISGQYAILKSPVLSRNAENHKRDYRDHPEKIEELCGDSFVSQVELGARLLVQARFEFANAQAKSEFDGKIGFDYLNLFEVEGAATVLSEDARKNSTISISAIQVGGSPEKLLGTLAGTNREGKDYTVIECSIENAAACTQALNSFLQYASDTKKGFPSQLGELELDLSTAGGAAVLGYTLTSYGSGSSSTAKLYDTEPDLIDSMIAGSRRWLSQRFDELRIDQKRTNELLRLHLTPKKRGEVKQIERTIANNLWSLQAVVRTCYEDLSQCVRKQSELAQKFAASAHSYDRAALSKKYTFVDYCLLRNQRESIVRTVDAIKEAMGYRPQENDCLNIYQDIMGVSSLDLSAKELLDVRPLRGLDSLQDIDLSHNRIRNPSPIFGLTRLERLNLRDNNASSIRGIEKMTSLESLDVAYNQLAEIEAAWQLPALRELRAHGNQIDAVEGQVQSALRVLSIEESDICRYAAERLVARGEFSADVMEYYLSLDTGPAFRREGDVTSAFMGWVNCAVAAKSL